MAPNNLVLSFTHLKGRPKADDALPLLKRIASLVKPIMLSHDWVLPTLGEFFPNNDSLVGLNINAGEKILLRLRPAWAPGTFYDEEHLVAVMLHELTHNVHGLHDSKFYAFLSKLESEYAELKRTGYVGEGFHSPGVRLGTGVSHNPPQRLAKQKALAAAEKRRQMDSLMKSGGRLGGIAPRNKTAQQLAAEAAEKRAIDEKACASTHGEAAKEEAQRAAQDSIVDIIDVDALPDLPPQTIKRELSPDIIILDNSSDPNSSTQTAKPKGLEAVPNTLIASKDIKTGQWTCQVCTLVNLPLALQCDACLSQRPSPREHGWSCLSCGWQGISDEFWTCRVCGWVQLK